MHYCLQNAVWLLKEVFGSHRRGDLLAEISLATGRRVPVKDWNPEDCSYHVGKKMLAPNRLRTIFILKGKSMERLDAFASGAFSDCKRSPHEQFVLFYPKDGATPVCVIGPGRGYVFLQIVREQNAEPGAAPNGGLAARSVNSEVTGGPPSVSRSLGAMTRPLKTILVVVVAVLAVVAYPVLRPELQRASFQKNIKKRVTPEELQAWAMGVLQTQDTHKPYDRGTVTNLHPAFRGLFINAPFGNWYSASPEDAAFVRVTYGGGGGGHWGVEVGPTNRPTPQSTECRRYTPWTSGVCFFNGQ